MGLLNAFLNVIFPERDDHKIIREISAEDFTRHIRLVQHKNTVHLLPFSEPAVRAAIHEAKFHHNEKAWALLADVLSSYLKHQPKGTVLVPIPLSSKRKRERGYNQVEEVAKLSILNASQVVLRADVLYRSRHTPPQTSLTRRQRLKNVARAFKINPIYPLNGNHVIVLDDVTTTGATLEAAEASLLLLKPSSVTLLSLAH